MEIFYRDRNYLIEANEDNVNNNTSFVDDSNVKELPKPVNIVDKFNVLYTDASSKHISIFDLIAQQNEKEDKEDKEDKNDFKDLLDFLNDNTKTDSDFINLLTDNNVNINTQNIDLTGNKIISLFKSSKPKQIKDKSVDDYIKTDNIINYITKLSTLQLDNNVKKKIWDMFISIINDNIVSLKGDTELISEIKKYLQQNVKIPNELNDKQYVVKSIRDIIVDMSNTSDNLQQSILNVNIQDNNGRDSKDILYKQLLLSIENNYKEISNKSDKLTIDDKSFQFFTNLKYLLSDNLDDIKKSLYWVQDDDLLHGVEAIMKLLLNEQYNQYITLYYCIKYIKLSK